MSTPDPQQRTNPHAVALLLAAGRGRRFDETGEQNKLLAPLGGEPVAVHAARHLLACELPVVAVVRPNTDALRQVLGAAGCDVTVCDQADLGMGHSLAHGAAVIQAKYAPQVLLVALADMPFLSPDTIRAVVNRVDANHQIVAAAIDGKRGHPVGFWHEHLPALQQLVGDNGASALLKSNSVTLVDASSDAVIRDIDRPQDLPAD